MTIDPKRMERIWEKCPELRPTRRERKLTCLPVDPAFTRIGPTWCWADTSGNVRDPEHPEDIKPLIRDACVCWLAKQGSHVAMKTGSSGLSMMTFGLKYSLGNNAIAAMLQLVERVLDLPEWES